MYIYLQVKSFLLLCCYQLQGHKKLVIDGVTKYFIEQDARHKDHDPNEFRYD